MLTVLCALSSFLKDNERSTGVRFFDDRFKDWSRASETLHDYVNATVTVPRQYFPSKRQIIQGPKDYSCELCGKIFYRANSLKRHQDASLRRNRRNFTTCDVCQIRFCSGPLLVKHIKETHEVLQKCRMCRKAFGSSLALRRHQETNRNELSLVKCNRCMRVFNGLYRLRDHMRQHSGDRPFKCEICLRTFVVKGNYNRHYKSMHLKLKHTCKECNQSYTDISNFKNHQKNGVCSRRQLEFRIRTSTSVTVSNVRSI
mmetsp:Transcript_16037/g.24162  ORF Transcript_16037/g.24162 Transcript_16037/m.24162 type:complete len:257 (+) Transcript_16037:52-822(+)